ncbi:hypothetical protein [Nocardia sp. NPDC052566]|uniref:hypothetical protein n=1 Tax=Nocardia sp. NPDC052566 TaxID=3364330 RepID=UPI0037C8F651
MRMWGDLFLTLPGLGGAPRPDPTSLDEDTANLLDVLARHSWKLTGDTLGTDYADEGYALAVLLVCKAPEVAREKDIPTQSAIITWVIASRHDLLGQDCGLDIPNLSRELGSTSRELFDGAKRVREATGG